MNTLSIDSYINYTFFTKYFIFDFINFTILYLLAECGPLPATDTPRGDRRPPR
jgi:hypothetical protein